MIPQCHDWKVTFFKTDGSIVSHVVCCVKRFAIMIAQDEIGYHMHQSSKVTVGLVKGKK